MRIPRWEHGRGEQGFSKHRAEALSDGVFAIAMTLLVLELKVPSGFAPGQLWAALGEERALWYSLLLTFGMAALFWTLQHRVFDLLDRLSEPNMALTLVTLGLVAVLPFSTSLLGHAKGDRLAFQLYFGNQLAIALSLVVKLEIAKAQGELRAEVSARHTRLRLWSIALVMLSAVLAAPYQPINRMWMAPIGVGLITRLIRARLERKKR